ncbi:MAG: hypothetical protein LPH21_18460 [Shewanella sp.]|nr:hypothetical protein [Shewanella sp.]
MHKNQPKRLTPDRLVDGHVYRATALPRHVTHYFRYTHTGGMRSMDSDYNFPHLPHFTGKDDPRLAEHLKQFYRSYIVIADCELEDALQRMMKEASEGNLPEMKDVDTMGDIGRACDKRSLYNNIKNPQCAALLVIPFNSPMANPIPAQYDSKSFTLTVYHPNGSVGRGIDAGAYYPVGVFGKHFDPPLGRARYYSNRFEAIKKAITSIGMPIICHVRGNSIRKHKATYNSVKRMVYVNGLGHTVGEFLTLYVPTSFEYQHKTLDTVSYPRTANDVVNNFVDTSSGRILYTFIAASRDTGIGVVISVLEVGGELRVVFGEPTAKQWPAQRQSSSPLCESLLSYDILAPYHDACGRAITPVERDAILSTYRESTIEGEVYRNVHTITPVRYDADTFPIQSSVLLGITHVHHPEQAPIYGRVFTGTGNTFTFVPLTPKGIYSGLDKLDMDILHEQYRVVSLSHRSRPLMASYMDNLLEALTAAEVGDTTPPEPDGVPIPNKVQDLMQRTMQALEAEKDPDKASYYADILGFMEEACKRMY